MIILLEELVITGEASVINLDNLIDLHLTILFFQLKRYLYSIIIHLLDITEGHGKSES